MLVDHMTEGLGLESFGPKIGVHRDTLYEWKKHQDFSDAIKKGQGAAFSFWEKVGRQMAIGKLQGSTAAWIFWMKARFGWKDRQEISGPNNQPLTMVIKKYEEPDGD